MKPMSRQAAASWLVATTLGAAVLVPLLGGRVVDLVQAPVGTGPIGDRGAAAREIAGPAPEGG